MDVKVLPPGDYEGTYVRTETRTVLVYEVSTGPHQGYEFTVSVPALVTHTVAKA